MTTFEHITETEILLAAKHTLMMRWLKETERNRAYREKRGKDSTISVNKIKKLDIQIDEIRNRILELEIA